MLVKKQTYLNACLYIFISMFHCTACTCRIRHNICFKVFFSCKFFSKLYSFCNIFCCMNLCLLEKIRVKRRYKNYMEIFCVLCKEVSNVKSYCIIFSCNILSVSALPTPSRHSEATIITELGSFLSTPTALFIGFAAVW